jgi:hypothetical protein
MRSHGIGVISKIRELTRINYAGPGTGRQPQPQPQPQPRQRSRRRQEEAGPREPSTAVVVYQGPSTQEQDRYGNGRNLFTKQQSCSNPVGVSAWK